MRSRMISRAIRFYLDGYICKEPIYRKTPLGREIADLLVAVNRSYGKSDYIPCICWEEMRDMPPHLRWEAMSKYMEESRAGGIY